MSAITGTSSALVHLSAPPSQFWTNLGLLKTSGTYQGPPTTIKHVDCRKRSLLLLHTVDHYQPLCKAKDFSRSEVTLDGLKEYLDSEEIKYFETLCTPEDDHMAVYFSL